MPHEADLTIETFDRQIILQKIGEVEQQIALRRKQQENAEEILESLKERLAPDEYKTTLKHPAEVSLTTAADLTSDQKILLFLRLFRGRKDVYPRFWQNRNTGKLGYSPACVNEWVHGVCEKPQIKCRECPNQAFLPVTTQVILDHLQGLEDWQKRN